jgi:BNR repeat protein
MNFATLALALSLAVEISPLPPGFRGRQPQLASDGKTLALTFGAGNSVYFARSGDQGRTWTKPAIVSSTGRISLGMHRGPRVAFAGKALLISATVDEGSGGNLLVWRSLDGGSTWSKGYQVNGLQAAAREGLHAMAARGDRVFLAWLDSRSKGTKLFGALSSDGGATWMENHLIYESASGSICECCAPSVSLDERGTIYTMFRNNLVGNRDLYLTRSRDGGKTFEPAQRLGAKSWNLSACPMDGGDLKIGAGGQPVAVWRRDAEVFLSDSKTPEKRLGPGRNPALAIANGVWAVWTEGDGLRILGPSDTHPRWLTADGAFPSLVTIAPGRVIAAWESKRGIQVQELGP